MQSSLLQMLGDRTYNWAMDQYARGEAVTAQTIANFMEMSGKAEGLTDTIMHQYQDQIKPLMDNYIREAGSYASEGRQRFEAGEAMSTVGQADAAAMNEIERKLEGQGINVNSGRIQEQMIASRVADAAARAGAGTAAAQHTEDVGRQMTENALKMGLQLPSMAWEGAKTTMAGLTGAENAILGLLNTGKNLADAAAPYYNAAVGANKVPPVGQTAQSTSEQKSIGQAPPPPQGGGAGGGRDGEQKKQPNKEREEGDRRPPAQQRQSASGGGEGAGQKFGPPANTSGYGKAITIPGAGTGKKDDDEQATGAPAEEGYQGPIGYVDDTGTIYPEMSLDAGTTTWEQALSEPEVSNWTLPEVGSRGFNTEAGSAGGGNFQLGGNANLGASWDDALSNALPMQGGNYSSSGVDESGFIGADYGDSRLGGQNFQQYASRGDIASDVTGSEAYIQEGARGGQDFSNYDDSGSEYQYDAGDDYSDWTDDGSNYDDSGSEYQYNAGDDYSDWTDDGSNYDDSGSEYQYNAGDDYSDFTDYDYARGGQVRVPPRRPMRGGVMPTTGGAVPRSASPSQGRQTDDISARLNAGEYVIPRDVVKHQGTKFFTDLIAKSRKLRTGMAGAKPRPTMRPALPQERPTFRSRALPPR
jgi:hypothetical protein